MAIPNKARCVKRGLSVIAPDYEWAYLKAPANRRKVLKLSAALESPPRGVAAAHRLTRRACALLQGLTTADLGTDLRTAALTALAQGEDPIAVGALLRSARGHRSSHRPMMSA